MSKTNLHFIYFQILFIENTSTIHKWKLSHKKIKKYQNIIIYDCISYNYIYIIFYLLIVSFEARIYFLCII